MENFIDLLDPKKAADLSPEKRAQLKDLTDVEIEALAKAYPNTPRGNNYLILKNTKLADGKQLYPVSTWQNFMELRNKLGQKHWQVLDFKQFVDLGKKAVVGAVQDLTKKDISGAEGIKEVGAVQNLKKVLQPGDEGYIANDGNDGSGSKETGAEDLTKKDISSKANADTKVDDNEQALIDAAAKNAGKGSTTGTAKGTGAAAKNAGKE